MTGSRSRLGSSWLERSRLQRRRLGRGDGSLHRLPALEAAAADPLEFALLLPRFPAASTVLPLRVLQQGQRRLIAGPLHEVLHRLAQPVQLPTATSAGCRWPLHLTPSHAAPGRRHLEEEPTSLFRHAAAISGSSAPCGALVSSGGPISDEVVVGDRSSLETRTKGENSQRSPLFFIYVYLRKC